MKRYKVVPLDAAYQDIDNILSYIRDDLANGLAADRYAKLFETAFQNLSTFVHGHPLLENLGSRYQNIRLIHVKKFVIFYVVDEEKSEAVILRVAHTMMDWRKFFDE